MFPPHCIEGTAETEVIPELAAKFPGEIIKKKRYSGFSGTDLAPKIKKLKPEKIIIVGVCTDICVCHTAADARALDYNVEVPADCVASFNARSHVYALEHMEKVLGAKIVYPPVKICPNQSSNRRLPLFPGRPRIFISPAPSKSSKKKD